MNKLILTGSLAIILAGALSAAAAGTIRTKKDGVKDAVDIKALTVSGVIWDAERNRPGIRVKPWDIDIVRYSGSEMDTFNSLARKLSGGRGGRLIEDANSYIDGEKVSGFSDDQWARDVVLSSKYFRAMGHFLNNDFGTAVSELESYIKEAEGKIFSGSGTVARVSFASKVSGKRVSDAGGLNLYYLDALENLGMAYLRSGDAKSANDKAFNPLKELCDELYKSARDKEYYDWGLRALRKYANFAEGTDDFKGAREAYDEINRIALTREGGRPSRASHEASLKVGFMLIREGDTRNAKARFFEAIRNWENAEVDPNRVERAAPPVRDWINSDVAYLTAGSYTGQGMVLAYEARSRDDWSEAYENFSKALSIFTGDDEIRSMALLGAANACAQLADQSSGNETAASVYAKLAEKYLSELITLLPKTKAAEDESIPDIQKLITKYGGGE